MTSDQKASIVLHGFMLVALLAILVVHSQSQDLEIAILSLATGIAGTGAISAYAKRGKND